MPTYEPGESYAATVTRVVDGDTVYVEFEDGTGEKLRVIGVDTPETPENRRYERPAEWEGIEDVDYLLSRGEAASAFAADRLTDARVTVSFDENEPVRDPFGRLLAYVAYGADDERVDYNRELLEEGHARVYGSGLTRHDEFWDVERSAREAGRGLWERSDLGAVPEIRDRPVDDLFFPTPAAVETASGALDPSRVPVFASETAERRDADAEGDGGGGRGSGDGEAVDDRIPLVGVDEDARLGVVGGLLVDETYESSEGFPVDTAGFENYVFVTNLLDSLSEASGDVLVDGGNGQFTVDYALSSEDAAYYGRYLEGQGLLLQQNNSLSEAFLDLGRALIVTPPRTPIPEPQLDLVRTFRDDGGSVLLLGGADAPPAARSNLNAVAEALGSDLRLGDGRVVDEERNVDDDPRVPTTGRFDRSFPLFDAFSPGAVTPRLAVVAVQAEADSPVDESVTLANVGSDSLQLSNWTLSDAAGATFAFPALELRPGDRVTVRTGRGTDRTTLHWGRESYVWNDEGDTIVVRDGEDEEVLRTTYDASDLADESDPADETDRADPTD
jgi:endonuclease YncB( thermonuclease family)